MSERDPKIDPVKGDILRREKQTVEITEVNRHFGFVFDGSPMPVELLTPWNRPWKPTWRKWAATAEVIKRGDE